MWSNLCFKRISLSAVLRMDYEGIGSKGGSRQELGGYLNNPSQKLL